MKEDGNLFRKEDFIFKDILNFKLVLVGEGFVLIFFEKKIVIFVEFFNGGGEIKVLYLVGRDGKRDVVVLLILGIVIVFVLYVFVLYSVF